MPEVIGEDEHGHPIYAKPAPAYVKPKPPAKKPPGSPQGQGGSRPASGPKPGPPPRSQFDPYKRGSQNSAYQQAVGVVENFLQVMGWPSGIKAEKLEMAILQNGTYLSPERAYNYLFTLIPKKLQDANPNAEFGMTQDTYVQQLNAFKDSWDYFTGTPDIPHDVLRMSIDQGWTQTEMMDFLKKDSRFNDPKMLPWLQAGMGYRDVSNQFFQTYGKAPTDVKQLSSWFQFKTSAAELQPAQIATNRPTTGPTRNQSQSEIR